jgi:hypothetical protein
MPAGRASVTLAQPTLGIGEYPTKSAIPMDGAIFSAATLTTAGTYAVPVFNYLPGAYFLLQTCARQGNVLRQ